MSSPPSTPLNVKMMAKEWANKINSDVKGSPKIIEGSDKVRQHDIPNVAVVDHSTKDGFDRNDSVESLPKATVFSKSNIDPEYQGFLEKRKQIMSKLGLVKDAPDTNSLEKRTNYKSKISKGLEDSEFSSKLKVKGIQENREKVMPPTTKPYHKSKDTTGIVRRSFVTVPGKSDAFLTDSDSGNDDEMKSVKEGKRVKDIISKFKNDPPKKGRISIPVDSKDARVGGKIDLNKISTVKEDSKQVKRINTVHETTGSTFLENRRALMQKLGIGGSTEQKVKIDSTSDEKGPKRSGQKLGSVKKMWKAKFLETSKEGEGLGVAAKLADDVKMSELSSDKPSKLKNLIDKLGAKTNGSVETTTSKDAKSLEKSTNSGVSQPFDSDDAKPKNDAKGIRNLIAKYTKKDPNDSKEQSSPKLGRDEAILKTRIGDKMAQIVGWKEKEIIAENVIQPQIPNSIFKENRKILMQRLGLGDLSETVKTDPVVAKGDIDKGKRKVNVSIDKPNNKTKSNGLTSEGSTKPDIEGSGPKESSKSDDKDSLVKKMIQKMLKGKDTPDPEKGQPSTKGDTTKFDVPKPLTGGKYERMILESDLAPDKDHTKSAVNQSDDSKGSNGLGFMEKRRALMGKLGLGGPEEASVVKKGEIKTKEVVGKLKKVSKWDTVVTKVATVEGDMVKREESSKMAEDELGGSKWKSTKDKKIKLDKIDISKVPSPVDDVTKARSQKEASMGVDKVKKEDVMDWKDWAINPKSRLREDDMRIRFGRYLRHTIMDTGEGKFIKYHRSLNRDGEFDTRTFPKSDEIIGNFVTNHFDEEDFQKLRSHVQPVVSKEEDIHNFEEERVEPFNMLARTIPSKNVFFRPWPSKETLKTASLSDGSDRKGKGINKSLCTSKPKLRRRWKSDSELYILFRTVELEWQSFNARGKEGKKCRTDDGSKSKGRSKASNETDSGYRGKLGQTRGTYDKSGKYLKWLLQTLKESKTDIFPELDILLRHFLSGTHGVPSQELFDILSMLCSCLDYERVLKKYLAELDSDYMDAVIIGSFPTPKLLCCQAYGQMLKMKFAPYVIPSF